MYEISNYVNRRVEMPLSVIQYPSGRWGFVGKVPEALAYQGSAEDLKTGRMMGMGLLIKCGRVKALAWNTRDDAIAAAEALGAVVANQ